MRAFVAQRCVEIVGAVGAVGKAQKRVPLILKGFHSSADDVRMTCAILRGGTGEDEGSCLPGERSKSTAAGQGGKSQEQIQIMTSATAFLVDACRARRR